MNLLDLPTEILEEILDYTVCMKGWRAYPYRSKFLAKRTVCRTFDILVSRCTVRRLDLGYLIDNSEWTWSIEVIAWILATKVAMSREDGIGLLGMIRKTGTMLSQVIKSSEGGTSQESGTKIKRSNTAYFIMDLWKEISGVFVASQGTTWVINELLSSGQETMDGVGSRSSVYESDILPILAWYGKDAIIRSFIDERQADPNVRSDLFGTPLYIAAVAGHRSIVTLLLERGARANEEGGHWGMPLLACIRHNRFPEIVKALLNAGADINLPGGECKFTPLLAALREDAEDIFVLLSESGNLDVTWKDDEGRTILYHACSRGCTGIAQRLLEHKNVDVDDPDNDSHTPLMAAVEFNHFDVVKLLLGKGAGIYMETNSGLSALSLAQTFESGGITNFTYEDIPRASRLIVDHDRSRNPGSPASSSILGSSDSSDSLASI